MIHRPSEETDSFYSFPKESGNVEYCSGTACFVARNLDLSLFEMSEKSETKTYCLGKCYLSPTSSRKTDKPRIEIRSKEAIILDNAVHGSILDLDSYIRNGGFSALRKALSMKPEDVINEVEHSSLRGRGGAGFPTGKKWKSVFNESSDKKYIVVNADEGDPGAYLDKTIMEYDPFKLLEGAMIAGYSVGSDKCYIYIRREYPDSISAIKNAIEDLRARNLLGENILNSSFSFEIEVVRGKGSYVCGEETAMLRSIEGNRPEVSLRPPYPTEKGLFDKPTVVNNVETLANVPWIILHGADKFSEIGFSKSKGTKVVSLNSLFTKPGLFEVDMGTTIDEIVNSIGGGLRTGIIKGVIVGGPLTGIVPPNKFDTRIGYEEMRSIGAELGHGGVIAFDENTSIKELIENISSFVAYESCGKCTPCRLGSREIQRIFSSSDEHRETHTEEDFDHLVTALRETSLCGLGSGLGEFLESAIANYKEDIDSCFA
ncbi:MAG: NADH-quinone oxidoreductase subunit L [Thermoplasmatales archaeon]|nr:NADH-quinone oxidoreductase subunit L [Thermoplasmatales archaeon]MCW6170743.1 NADH-quinone oxidoreductase subunit L [Thermoplasmatales archaeon]